jgi:excisionase family DNA binding protein
MQPTDPHEFLLLEEVANILRVHRNTMSAMLMRGEFPGAVKTTAGWRIPRVALDGYVSTHTPRGAR